MLNYKYFLAVLTCCVITTGFITGGAEEPIAGAKPIATPEPRFYADANPMPEEVMYYALFQQVDTLAKKDAEFRAQGETTTFKETFYRTRLNLAPAQFAAIETVKSGYLTGISALDARAREIIDKYRAKYPNGELKRLDPPKDASRMFLGYETPPPVPAELNGLQKQKDQGARDAREKIRQALGDEAFAGFESSLRAHLTRVLVPLKLRNNALPPIKPEGEVKR